MFQGRVIDEFPVAALTRRIRAGVIALSLCAAGCAYDPYTNSYVPCCTYPYPYPGYAGVVPPGAVQPGGPELAAPEPAPSPAPGPVVSAQPKLARRFAEANVTRDGMLTYQQAQANGWHVVVSNFASIDAGRKGYVTLEDVGAWFAANRPPHAAASN